MPSRAAALQALKKRKLYESQLESVENNIMRVNEQQMMLENQRTTVETVSALSNAAKASKQTMHEMKVRGSCCRWLTARTHLCCGPGRTLHGGWPAG